MQKMQNTLVSYFGYHNLTTNVSWLGVSWDVSKTNTINKPKTLKICIQEMESCFLR